MIQARPFAKSKDHNDAIKSVRALIASWEGQGWTKSSDIVGTMSSSPHRGIEWRFAVTMTRPE